MLPTDLKTNAIAKLARNRINKMTKKNQSIRLTNQHKKSQGVVGIFGNEAKLHDLTVGEISNLVIAQLEMDYPQLTFRYRTSIRKEEINEALKKIDPELGQTLFVPNLSIIPDGGIIEVKDDNDNWRVVLVSEAKHQGKDIENIKKGILVGKTDNQDLMAAGNAIERSHKNISEIIYTKGKGEKWNNKEMFDIMIEISKTSLKVLGSDLFNQITKK